GGARGPHRIGLIDGDGRRDARDRIDLGLVHAIEKLPCVRRERLDVAALSFRIERVEDERGLAGPRDAGHHHELVQRNVEAQVLQIVLARAPHKDRVAGSVGHSVTVRLRMSSEAQSLKEIRSLQTKKARAHPPSRARGRIQVCQRLATVYAAKSTRFTLAARTSPGGAYEGSDPRPAWARG